MRILLVITSLFILITGMSVFAQKKRFPPSNSHQQKTITSNSNTAQELQFTIKLDKNVYRVGERILCEISLQNISNHKLEINNRLLVNHSQYPHEIYFKVIKDKNFEMDFLPQVDASFEHEYYGYLLPNQTSKLKYSYIAKDYGLSLPGTYVIQAFYENNSDAPLELKLPNVWKGMIKSNEILFRIE